MSASASPRVVSLVPSLTQTLHDLGVGAWIVGVTKFCVHPDAARETASVVGGTKDPDVDAIRALEPQLVVADADENKPEHLALLERTGIRVHVTRVDSVADAAREVVAIGRLLGRGVQAEAWLQRIQSVAAEISDAVSTVGRLRVFVPVWRSPLMTAAPSTYLSDMLRIAGADNVVAHAPSRYFETTWPEAMRWRPDAVVLPTEPYRFDASHRDEFAQELDLPREAIEVVDGEALTWFGTATAAGLEEVAAAVGRLRVRVQKI